MNALLDDLQKKGILKQTGSRPHEKSNHGTFFLNPLKTLKENDSFKIVLDARYLNSNTDNSYQSSEFLPLEPLATQLAWANKNYKSAIDLMYAIAQATLNRKTNKLTAFSSVEQISAFKRGIYGLKVPPNIFTQQTPPFFKGLIRQGSALDVLMIFYSSQT